jgi:outer membrane lipoprotein LolB
MLVAGCATLHPPRSAPAPWEPRLRELQALAHWQADGRAAVAVDTQGWQATLSWIERDGVAEVHLSGPFGIGAMVIRQSPEGVSLNGGASGAAVLTQLKDRLGFDLPLESLRFWLLGIPAPEQPFELTRNAQDRASHLTQAQWSIDYDRYVPVNGDLLPARVVMSREQVRVRIVIEQWKGS